MLNGYALDAHVDEQEHVMLALASGELSREQLLTWVERYAHPAEAR